MASHAADLRIEVDGLQRGPREFRFQVPPEALDLVDDPEYTFPSPVEGHVRANFVGQENVYVSCHLGTQAQATCVRCLELLPIRIELDLSLVFLPLPPGGADDADPEDEEKLYYSGGMIHLGERLREEIMLALPFLPACELGKDNVCPVSGTRVEPVTFGESADEADPENGAAASWQAQLKQVRRELDDESES